MLHYVNMNNKLWITEEKCTITVLIHTLLAPWDELSEELKFPELKEMAKHILSAKLHLKFKP